MTRLKIVAAACLLLLGLHHATHAQGTDADITPAMHKVIDGAKQEGKLTLVWGNHVLGGPAGAQEAKQLILKKYGVDLDVSFTTGPSGPAMNAAMIQELAANQPAMTDLHPHNVGPSTYDLWTPIDWRELVPGLPESAMYLDQRGVAIVSPLIGITYNTQLVTGDMVPKGLHDLLKPEWKGKFASPPYLYGLEYFALPQLMGYDKAVAFVAAFEKQVGGLTRCGEEDRVASGEFLAFATDCGDYEVRKRAPQGQPVGWVLPEEGAILANWLAGVPRNSAHPNAAKLYIAFLLSKEGQDFAWRMNANDSAQIPGSHMYEMVKAYQAKGLTVVDGNRFDRDPVILKARAAMNPMIQNAGK
jgi:iron(III) transport system substrate-binding protein